jgi:hypothetical protein
MGCIFDMLVAAHQRQQARCVSALQREIGNASDHLCSNLSRLFTYDLPLQLKYLRHAWPVTVAHQYVAGLQPSLLDTAVPAVHHH